MLREKLGSAVGTIVSWVASLGMFPAYEIISKLRKDKEQRFVQRDTGATPHVQFWGLCFSCRSATSIIKLTRGQEGTGERPCMSTDRWISQRALRDTSSYRHSAMSWQIVDNMLVQPGLNLGIRREFSEYER